MSKSDCHPACKSGGICESYCGLNGYCCRQGSNDCNLPAQAAASSDTYTCVRKSIKPTGLSPNNEQYVASVTVISNGCSSDFISSTGHTCSDYINEKWCQDNGKLGENWNTSWGQFATWKSPIDGKTAWSCPECGCNTRPGYSPDNTIPTALSDYIHPDSEFDDQYNIGYTNAFGVGFADGSEGKPAQDNLRQNFNDSKSAKYVLGYENGYRLGYQQGYIQYIQTENIYQHGYKLGYNRGKYQAEEGQRYNPNTVQHSQLNQLGQQGYNYGYEQGYINMVLKNNATALRKYQEGYAQGHSYGKIQGSKGLDYNAQHEVVSEKTQQYQYGFRHGYKHGYRILSQHIANIYKRGYETGKKQGIADGQDDVQFTTTTVSENSQYQQGYQHGYEVGYQEGYYQRSIGTNDAVKKDNTYYKGYKSGFTEAQKHAFTGDNYTHGVLINTENTQMQTGFLNGYERGYAQFYNAMYTDDGNGFTTGYHDGYQTGYQQGRSDNSYSFGDHPQKTDQYISGFRIGYKNGYHAGSLDAVDHTESYHQHYNKAFRLGLLNGQANHVFNFPNPSFGDENYQTAIAEYHGFQYGYIKGQSRYTGLSGKSEYYQGYIQGHAAGTSDLQQNADYSISTALASVDKFQLQYQAGYSHGYTAGYISGMNANPASDTSYGQGFNQGKINGENDGRTGLMYNMRSESGDSQFNIGYEHAYRTSYRPAFENAKSFYQQGYSLGKIDGQLDGFSIAEYLPRPQSDNNEYRKGYYFGYTEAYHRELGIAALYLPSQISLNSYHVYRNGKGRHS